MSNCFYPAEAVVTVEFPSGEVFSASALAVSFSVEQPRLDVTSLGGRYMKYAPAQAAWTLEMQGTSSLTLTVTDDLIESLEEQTELEWRCPFCGNVNSADTSNCCAGQWDGCGGARPILYTALRNACEN